MSVLVRPRFSACVRVAYRRATWRSISVRSRRAVQGERVALVGPSGAGKTTVLRLCTGAVAPTSGSVTVFGEGLDHVSTEKLRSIRSRIGSVNQDLALIGPLRVVHNVNAGLLGRWTTMRAHARVAGAAARGADGALAALDRLGIAHKMGERTDRLSGGEQQRVALARVLAQDPELILADEPVASLDPARADEVIGLLCDVVAGEERALIVSLHDFDLARRRCGRVVGVRDGRVAFDAPASEVTDEMA